MRRVITSLALLLFICSLLTVGCERVYNFEDGKISGVETIEDLDEAAIFSFAIMSDNKGDAPMDKPEFARMVEWIDRSEDQFVIGLGDHVKKGWDNNFLGFLAENQWWNQNFYPNIADGENEYYGESQGDWGAGGAFLEVVKLGSKPGVNIRGNKCEYYAQIQVDNYIVHLIQLHFPDQPEDDSLAFRPDSREYLVNTLNSIEKSPGDIIIAAAHSRSGFWLQLLSEAQKAVVMDKCDLVLSATTHFFERQVIPGFENSGPLILNTGSITYPSTYCPSGYIQVHVLKHPFSLVIQYMNAGYENREMQYSEFAYLKKIDGSIIETNFRETRPDEDVNRVIGKLPVAFSREQMDDVAQQLYYSVSNADKAIIKAASGLDKGEIKYKDLWEVFPFNNEVYVITLNKAEVVAIFENTEDLGDKTELKIAINNYNGSYLISHFKIADDRVVKTGKREIPLLENWVFSFKSGDFPTEDKQENLADK